MSVESNQPGIVRRGLATLVDIIVVPVVSLLVMLVTGAMEHAEAYAGAQPYLRAFGLGVAGYLVINGLLLHKRGQTVGKALVGIMIVSRQTGEKAKLWRLILIRALFFPLLYLPVLFPLVGALALLPVIDQAFIFRRDRRCLHDLAADTCVVLRTP